MKEILAILLGLLITLTSFFGFTDFETIFNEITGVQSEEDIIEEQSQIIKIGFSKGYNNDTIEKVMTPEEISAWENPYSEYSSYVIYNKLETDEEKLIYKALEYAMVNSYSYTYIDDRIDVTRDTMEDVARFLSLDTPLLEQNLKLHLLEYNAAFYDYEYEDEKNVSVVHRSTTIVIDNFTDELWETKMEALEEAEKIVKAFDTNASQIDLAEEIYRYIALGVEYIPYESDRGIYQGDYAPFLNDALIKKKTHCDGFTNALALLYEMTGFEQVEKQTYNHTYNCVKIGDNWYNIDGTGGGYIPDHSETMGGGFAFAFCDELAVDPIEYMYMYPDCPKSYYMNIGAWLTTYTDEQFYEYLERDFTKNKNEWSIILINDFEKEEEGYTLAEQISRLATNTNTYKLMYYSIEKYNNYSIIYVVNSNLFE